MLKLKNIKKEYGTGQNKVFALKGIDIEFRDNEFVSILGPSGCGKTTLLNIIGGLDRYTSGDIVISGRSTKSYKDSDWDTYRNHTIGFVFQSYNLIPHQSVLSNVELALTLSGVSRSKRREKAKEALIKVGLGDQINKKPNQLSGGQMQRVAIARAIVNDPDVLLADEPTGALDSETSVQILDLLKEIAEDRLVIIVTHNPELAEKYSTRIIKLFDGTVIDDSDPYSAKEEKYDIKKQKRPTMSFFTALSLSVKNLLTKKTRTILTGFAGSIGIIGIALILSLSAGVEAFINSVEEDTLSSYPITIEKSTTNIGEMISTISKSNDKIKKNTDQSKIYSYDAMTDIMTSMINGSKSNDLKSFKEYVDKSKKIKDNSLDIKYSYTTTLNIYTDKGYKVNPSDVFEKMGFNTEENRNTNGMGSAFVTNTSVWQELLDNKDLLKKQYKVLDGRFPEKYNEIVIVVGKYNEINDYMLYTLGLKDKEELSEIIKRAMNGEKIEPQEQSTYTFKDLMSLSFKLLVNSDYYTKTENGIYEDHSDDDLYITNKLNNCEDIKVVGILKPNEDASISSDSGSFVGYTKELMTNLINKVNESDIAIDQKNNPLTDILTGLPFPKDEEITIENVYEFIETRPYEEQAQYNAYIAQMRSQGLTDKQIADKFSSYLKQAESGST
ncbi:MAG: ABC transporter ATP-binding protein, partial [Clostridia bacterium]|nr:ABC transporter ATP-binding protein [Clostridia bacterium]